jgi:hypothetical protein
VTGQPVCPQCSTPVELDWEWCHHCGFDPDGKRPAVTPLLSQSRARSGETGAAVGTIPSFDAPVDTGFGLGEASTGFDLGAESTGFDLGTSPGGGLGPDPHDAGSEATGFATSSAFEDAQLLAGDDPFALGPPAAHGASSLGDPAGGFPPLGDAWGAPPPSSFGSDLLAAPAPSADGFHEPFVSQPLGAEDHADPFGGDLYGYAGDEVPFGATLSPTSPLLPPPPSGLPPFAGGDPGDPGAAIPLPTMSLGAPGGPRAAEPGKRRALNVAPPDSAVLKFVAIALAGILSVGAVTLVLVGAAGDERPNPSATTLDPSAPPPIGQLNLGGRSTTSGLSAPPAAVAAGWVTYRAPDGSFAVNFPGNPTPRGYQHRYQDFVQNGLEVWMAVGTDGPVYSAAYIDLPSAGLYADSQEAFDQTMASTAEAQSVYEPGPGLVGLQFTEKPSRGEAAGRGLFLAAGRRIYILEAANASDEDYAQFIQSFRRLHDV